MSLSTIYALSSGAGLAGVAVIRISGEKAFGALAALTKHPVEQPLPKPRVAVLRALTHPASGTLLDKALVLTFKGPASFTGEDCVELHVHGGSAVIEGVLEALSSISGLRLAERGEFTRRAFEAGKLDLTEAEGLNDLLHATTEAQRALALKQMDGALSHLYEDWRTRLIRLLAHIEADLEFPDEDLPDGIGASLLPQVEAIEADIHTHLASTRKGLALRDGYRIVILGEPNAGKSTLLNALARSDVAIVSDEPGTTRDIVDVSFNFGGFAVRLLDTAGLRTEGAGQIEAEGIRRAEEQADIAGLKLVLVRSDVWPNVPTRLLKHLDEGAVLVVTQTDRIKEGSVFHVEHLHPALKAAGLPTEGLHGLKLIPISAKTGGGVEALIAHITHIVSRDLAPSDAPVLTRLRHKTALEDCLISLSQFKAAVDVDAVLGAEELRLAARALGRITGRVSVEDVLDSLFHDFCIGK